jgi:hypothetical protein
MRRSELFQVQRDKAWQRGFDAGHTGQQTSPPYLATPLAERLIQAWGDGHRAGLAEYAREVEKERLEKMKRVDAMRGPR